MRANPYQVQFFEAPRRCRRLYVHTFTSFAELRRNTGVWERYALFFSPDRAATNPDNTQPRQGRLPIVTRAPSPQSGLHHHATAHYASHAAHYAVVLSSLFEDMLKRPQESYGNATLQPFVCFDISVREVWEFHLVCLFATD